MDPLKKSFLLVFVFLSLANPGCKEEKFSFPYVSINANIGISSDLGDLGSGRVKIFPVSRFGGVGGLIVYRDFDDIYHVYDAACTHDYFDDCFVEESPSFGELMVCPCCSSSYLMSSDGGVFEGPAVHPLIPYDSFIDGGFLRVVN